LLFREPAAGEWADAMVIEWAKILRLPPYEGAYPERPRMSKCGCPTPREVDPEIRTRN